MNPLRKILVAFRRWRTPWWRHIRVDSDADGITVFSMVDPRAEPKRIRWVDVREVEAFRRDSVEIELVCVTLTTADDAAEVSEKTAGWMAFVRKLRTALPDQFPEADWFPPGKGTSYADVM
jgi:hypothetical protein